MAAVLHLSEAHIRAVLKPPVLIKAMRGALQSFSRKDSAVVQPVRSVVPVASSGGFFGTMPGFNGDNGALGIKMVSFFPNNAPPLHTHSATIMLFDPDTGYPLCMMDGGFITEARTAAVSAVATDVLAPAECHTLAILGSGVQARSHIEMLSAVRDFKEIRIWSRTLANAEKLAAEVGGVACASAEEAVRPADVIATITSSKTPVLRGEWLKPGAHVNAVGACRPDWRELDDDALVNSAVVVDSRAGATAESGDIILSKTNIAAELGEIIGGTPLTNASARKTTVFKSLGMAVEDIEAAHLVYAAYKEKTGGF